MSEFIDVTSRETSRLRSISCSMQSYARAFSVTGNRDFADTLHEIADAINDSQDIISKAIGAEINRGYRESMKNTGETLSLILEKTLRDTEKVA